MRHTAVWLRTGNWKTLGVANTSKRPSEVPYCWRSLFLYLWRTQSILQNSSCWYIAWNEVSTPCISISRFEIPTPLAYTEQPRLLYLDTHPKPVYLMPPDFHYLHHLTKPRTAEKQWNDGREAWLKQKILKWNISELYWK